MTVPAIPLSARVGRIKPSPSMVARLRAQELKAQGRDIIDLTTGEPDFDTPAHIREATTAAMAAGETRYAPVNGTLRLRKAIIAKFARENGVTYAADEMTALTEVLKRHPHVALMTDDIYEHIRFDGSEPVCPVAIAPELRERTLLVNGVSKTYAMTGFRIGYGAGPKALVNAINVIQSQTTSGAASMCMAAAAAALEGDQSFVGEARSAYRQRRDRAVELLDAIDGMSCRKPDGAFYVYPSCTGLIGRRRPDGRVLQSDLDVALYLLEEAGVAVLDGSAYGLSPYLRLSIATSLGAIEEASARIKTACDALQRS